MFLFELHVQSSYYLNTLKSSLKHFVLWKKARKFKAVFNEKMAYIQAKWSGRKAVFCEYKQTTWIKNKLPKLFNIMFNSVVSVLELFLNIFLTTEITLYHQSLLNFRLQPYQYNFTVIVSFKHWEIMET